MIQTNTNTADSVSKSFSDNINSYDWNSVKDTTRQVVKAIVVKFTGCQEPPAIAPGGCRYFNEAELAGYRAYVAENPILRPVYDAFGNEQGREMYPTAASLSVKSEMEVWLNGLPDRAKQLCKRGVSNCITIGAYVGLFALNTYGYVYDFCSEMKSALKILFTKKNH